MGFRVRFKRRSNGDINGAVAYGRKPASLNAAPSPETHELGVADREHYPSIANVSPACFCSRSISASPIAGAVV